MAKSSTIKVLEQCEISPPATAAQEICLPLTYFDIPWLFFPPSQPLFFFEYPYPTSQLLSNTLPMLKHSLALTLQHLPPFAGNLTVLPQGQGHTKPHILYAHGDYVLLTIAESDGDFNRLSGNHQRHVNEFYSLVPELASTNACKRAAVPLLAMQLTVFSNVGLSMGFTYHRVVADGRTFNNFLKTWGSLCRDSSCLIEPFCRSAIKDPNGLEGIFLNEWCNRRSSQEMAVICNEMANLDLSNTVRATFFVSPNDMEKIKQWIISQCKNKSRPNPTHMSPSNLTCALIWVCYVKAQAKVNEKGKSMGEDPSYFGFNAGAITRLDYAIPTTYFGNCIGFARCLATWDELLGEDGIIVAADVIGSKVKELDKEILGGAEKWISDYEAFFGSELHVMVAGSPKLEFYETDFGWGKPKKIEEISIDKMRAISFTESRYVKGGIEVGLALPKAKMDAFTLFFNESLNVLQ